MKARAKELGLKGIRVNSAGCLDRCEFGPTLVIYPEGVWYSPKTRGDVDEILQAHLVSGGRARRLMLTEKDGRLVAEYGDKFGITVSTTSRRPREHEVEGV